MTTIHGQNKNARRALLMAAAKRWAERKAAREDALARVARGGVGAGDTPEHLARLVSRRTVNALQPLTFMERVIGPTVDFTPFAPNQLAQAAARPVGRIVTMPGPGFVPQGVATGFLIPGSLLLTNFHVFSAQSDVTGYGVNFNYFQDQRGLNEGAIFEFEPERFFLADKEFDFAIVAVKPVGTKGERLADQGEVKLIEATGKVATGAPLNIVQHPGGGPRQFAFTHNQLLDILPEGFLHYETDTEKGSSGSPVCNDVWELVGLHHCGVPCVENGEIMTRNHTVWNQEIDDEDCILWVANECVRVSFIVNRLKSISIASPSQQAILSALLLTTGDPAVPLARGPVVTAEQILRTNLPANTAAVFNFSGPVTINVSANPSGAETAVCRAPEPAERTSPRFEEKSLVFDPAYGQRAGYDADFLGVHVPMPRVDSSRSKELYTLGDYARHAETSRNLPVGNGHDAEDGAPALLHYHHYSLAFNKVYRMCHWTASNCDYSDMQRQDSRPRAAFGGENWRYDPRVPKELQLGNEDIYGPATRIDRGHIVRREDNAWGTPGLETEFANSDTYHWTNCTPQHEAFNQENPQDHNPKKTRIYDGAGIKGIWGEFEADLQAALARGGGQATIFAGPVLADAFPGTDWGKGKVSVPKKFWKVFVVPESTAKSARLQAYGYLFDQAPAVKQFGLTYEGIELPNFARQRISLREISSLTGVLFDKVIVDAEQMQG